MGQNETKIDDKDNGDLASNENSELASVSSTNNSPRQCSTSAAELAGNSAEPQSANKLDGPPTEREAELETRKSERFKMVLKQDLDYLVGNLEKLPESTRKLFNMAKLYLTSESSERSNEKDFISLFQPLPDTTTGDENMKTDVSDGTPVGATKAHFNCTNNLFVPLKKSAPLHYAQTYIQWKSAQDVRNFYSFCLPKRNTIYLQPIDEFPDFITTFRLKTHHLTLNLFEVLQGFAQIFFSGLEVLIRPPISMQDCGWTVRSRYHESTNKKQYCVNDVYPLLQNVLPADGVCIAGIIWTDIYPEGYNFVLGEASVKHLTAVISFGRFEPGAFDQDTHSDVTVVDGILMWKLLKSMSHELCHLFGLEHCTFFHCAMNESSSVETALSHPLFLCPVCLRKLQRVCGFDVLERYQQLKVFLTNLIAGLDNTSRLQDSLAWLNMCIEYLNS